MQVEVMKMKTLIAYFSWSNNTKKLVDKINEKKKYDVIRIERAIPYSDDYDICAYKEAKEEVNKKIHPAIKPLDIDFGNYDQILLFFPINTNDDQSVLFRLNVLPEKCLAGAAINSNPSFDV